jgi:hypothetical protein
MISITLKNEEKYVQTTLLINLFEFYIAKTHEVASNNVFYLFILLCPKDQAFMTQKSHKDTNAL